VALAAVKAAQMLVAPEALDRPLIVQGRSIHLSPRDIQRALAWSSTTDVKRGVLTLDLFERTCLLIGFYSGSFYHVELVDSSGFGWFARYVFPLDQPDPNRASH
jgi:hypothetical protein